MGRKRTKWISRVSWSLPCILVGMLPGIAAAEVGFVGTKITYQGRLHNGGSPANGPYDFQFKLVKLFSIQVGSTITLGDVDVSNGLFTVDLDFGDNYNSEQRWLDISVRPGASAGAYTHLLPVQELTPTPFAIYALKSGSAPCCTLDQSYDATASGQRVINVDDGPIRIQIPSNATNGMIFDGPPSGSGRPLGLYAQTSNDMINAWNDGTGRAAMFISGSASSSASAVEITTNGNSNSQALEATHSGLGDCSLFVINNANNAGEAVEARTNGSGDAVQAINTGTGRAGFFQISNNASAATALYVETNGTGLAMHTEGKIGIGTSTVPSGVLMAVDGKILCEELEVQLSQDWPDYVFENDYKLMPLSQVEEHIRQEKHLPGVPSAADVKSKGLGVGEMQAKLLEKVEELTLHMIDQNKRLDQVTKENERLRERLAALEGTRN